MIQQYIKKYVFVLGTFLSVGFFVLSAVTAYASTPILTSAKITGPNAVTLVYSTPVNTTLNDYGSFTGALSNMSLSGMSGSGTAIITLTFSGGTFASSATGGLTIASTVTSINDGSSIGSGPYSVTDGQAPLVSSVTLASNLQNGTVAQSGDTIMVTFSTNEPIYSPTVSIDNNNVSANGNGSGPYTASYTLSSSDAPNIVPVTLQYTDMAGNQGSEALTLGGGTGPRIVSISSDAYATGSLIPGNVINFVLTLANPAPGGFVSGSYDGVPLSWTTNNGGATYTATYTVQSGQTSTYTPLQISGVTIRDASGNVSLPASGSDIQKTINAQSFSISETTPVPSTSTTNTPQYTFYSSEDGVVTFGGDCTSLNQTAGQGQNYLMFQPLSNGMHSNCTIKVTDAAGYTSNTLTLTPFTVAMNGNTAVTNVAPVTGTLPIGCTSYIGYSVTTGQVCSTGSVTVTTPVTTTTNTPSTYSYKFYTPLDIGSSGTDVTALQERLTSEGMYSGPITGYYGALTQAAVKQYQGLHSLSQLGNVGPGTRALLNSGV